MRELLLPGVLGLAIAGGVASCAKGSSGVPFLDGGEGGSSADAGGAGDAGDGGDAGPTGDPLPASAVSFFQGTSCPMGWAPYTVAAGRFLVPTVATAPAGLTYGTPLDAGEDRTHTHNLTATFTLGSTSYVGLSGGNDGVTSAGAVTMTTTSDPASTGLPYIQLLVCRKNAAAVPVATPLPHGLQMFFDMASCPEGWLQTAATQGRFIVGLPQGAPQDVAFGGLAISSSLDAGIDVPTHVHGNTATLTTTSHGIALASGCCAGGYGANGAYPSTMNTDADDTGLPYLELLSCEKQ
jgi:hypothetical protein